MSIEVPITPYFVWAQESTDDLLRSHAITPVSGMTSLQEELIREHLQTVTRECPYLESMVIASSEALFFTPDTFSYFDEIVPLGVGRGCLKGVLKGFSVTEYQHAPDHGQIGLVAILQSEVEVDQQSAERFVLVPLDGESVVTAFLPEWNN